MTSALSQVEAAGSSLGWAGHQYPNGGSLNRQYGIISEAAVVTPKIGNAQAATLGRTSFTEAVDAQYFVVEDPHSASIGLEADPIAVVEIDHVQDGQAHMELKTNIPAVARDPIFVGSVAKVIMEKRGLSRIVLNPSEDTNIPPTTLEKVGFKRPEGSRDAEVLEITEFTKAATIPPAKRERVSTRLHTVELPSERAAAEKHAAMLKERAAA